MDTPFSLSYEKMVISVEKKELSYQVRHFQPDQNEEQMHLNLDLIEKKRNMAQIKAATYQQ